MLADRQDKPVTARQQGAPDEGQRLRLTPVWRRFEKQPQRLHVAEEAEEFQAVGMRCRQCLIDLVRLQGKPEMIPSGVQNPKRSDVICWSERIPNAIAAGSSSDYARDISRLSRNRHGTSRTG